MANLLENIETIEQQIRLFDDVRPKGTRIFLLKNMPDSAAFAPIIELAGGWFVKFNKFRDQMEFIFATTNDSFADLFAQATHIGYGIKDLNNKIDVFSIENRDKIPPNSAQPTWKCFGNRVELERYRVTDIAEDPPIFEITE